MLTRRRHYLFVLAVWAIYSHAVAQSPPSGTDNTKVGVELTAVVVTATKRDVRSQDVPLAVTPLSEQALRNLSATGLEDYYRSVPSMSVTDLGTGTQRVAIRGINPTSGVTSVKLYFGETPLPETRGNYGRSVLNPYLVDIERVEVLRGPQGTLYGAGSVGGTIRLMPKMPDTSQWSGYVQSAVSDTQDGGQGIDASAVANIPLATDIAGVRTALWYENADGFIGREFPGGSKDVPGEDTWGARVLGPLKVSDSLGISATVMHEDRHYGGIQDYTAGETNRKEELVQVTRADTPERVDLNSTIYNITAKWTPGNFEWTSSSSYVDLQRSFREEGTELVAVFFGDPPFPNSFQELYGEYDFTQEIRLNTIERIRGFDFLAGLFYDEWNLNFNQNWAPEGFSEVFFPIPDNNLFTSFGSQFSEEFSIFGELSYLLRKDLNLTLGIRHFDIENGSDLTFNGLFNSFLTTVNQFSSHSKGEVYKANLSYQPNPDALLYAQFAEGFRPGQGFATPPPLCGDIDFPLQLAPDTVASYELGAKTTSFDDRLLFNVAAYRIDWKDMQTATVLPCGFQIGLNSQTGAKVRGVEVETVLKLRPELLVGLRGAYNEATFNGDEQAIGAFAGDQVQDVPKWSGIAYLEYDFTFGSEWSGLFHADIQETDGAYSDFARLSDGVTRDPLSFRGITTLVNLRLSARRKNLEVALFGNNLTNDAERQERSQSAVFDVPGRPRYVVNLPRTVGIEVRLNFGDGS